METYIISSVTKISAFDIRMFIPVSFEAFESPFSVGSTLAFGGFFH